jgi:hypothetical protein
MMDVTSLDPSFNPIRSGGERPPTQDFATELAKDPGRSSAPRHVRAEDGARTSRTSGLPEPTDAATSANPESPLEALALEHLNTVVQPIGMTEMLLGSRIYGVHLLAGAYLSELSVSEAGQEALSISSDGLAGDDVPQPSMAVSVNVSSGFVEGEGQGVATSTEVPAVLASIPVESEDTATATDASMPADLATASAAVAFWPERSLRIHRDVDGGAVAWLRDYRLRSDDLPRVVDATLREAKDSGVVLSRIMLNGREAWSSRSDY